MPAHDGVRPHDDQGRAPIPPGVGEQHPKQSISRAEWGPRDRALEHRQLLTERQVLKRDRAVSARRSARAIEARRRAQPA